MFAKRLLFLGSSSAEADELVARLQRLRESSAVQRATAADGNCGQTQGHENASGSLSRDSLSSDLPLPQDVIAQRFHLDWKEPSTPTNTPTRMCN